MEHCNKDLFYTADHEWINFQHAVAGFGVSAFKLTGFRKIHKVDFNITSGFAEKGELVATLFYNEYVIEAHMPVSGTIVSVNNALTGFGSIPDIAESEGWIAHIIPSVPDFRDGLLLPEEYQYKVGRRYGK